MNFQKIIGFGSGFRRCTSRLQSEACEVALVTTFQNALHGTGTRVALIQRSCGYAPRPTLTIADIERAAALVKAQSAGCVVAVDNCYGEFTERREPCAVGAQIGIP